MVHMNANTKAELRLESLRLAMGLSGGTLANGPASSDQVLAAAKAFYEYLTQDASDAPKPQAAELPG